MCYVDAVVTQCPVKLSYKKQNKTWNNFIDLLPWAAVLTSKKTFVGVSVSFHTRFVEYDTGCWWHILFVVISSIFLIRDIFLTLKLWLIAFETQRASIRFTFEFPIYIIPLRNGVFVPSSPTNVQVMMYYRPIYFCFFYKLTLTNGQLYT